MPPGATPIDQREFRWSESMFCGILSGMGITYWIGAYTKHRLKYHLVWIPKYRKRILRGKVARRLVDLFYQACEVNRWYIHELNIQPDHIHMLIQLRPKESLTYVVQILKGETSKKIKEEFEDELEEFLWSESFWADGYFAESVGHLDEKEVQTYIREQNESMPQKKKYSGL